MIYIIMPLIGIVTGMLGTLIGAGGGFILMPVLLLMFPDMPVENVTFVSMTVIFFNALSGTFAYVRMKRVDFFTGAVFAAATIPGSIIGTFMTRLIDRSFFNPFFGAFMIALSLLLVLVKRNGGSSNGRKGHFIKKCSITDAGGEHYEYSYNMVLGIAVSIMTGFLSPILGIGGGIIHVPAMMKVLSFPAHIATATSHFTLMIMSFVSVVTHLFEKPSATLFIYAGLLSAGAIPGAQAGAKLSSAAKDKHIVYILAGALVLAGIRIIFMGR